MLGRVYLAGAIGALILLTSVGCNKNTATAIANASVNVTGPNTAVTGISIDPNSDQNLIRESQNGICIARKTFVVKVLPDGGGYSSSILPSTGATFAAGEFAATVNGTYVLTVSTPGNEYKASVRINVTGDCGGGNGENPNPPTNPPTNPPQVPAATAALTASPSTINVGQGSDLTWSSANAGYCSWIQGLSGDVGSSGTVRVTPGVTTNYRIRCFGSGGSGDAPATVTVNGQPPPPSTVTSIIVTPANATIALSGTPGSCSASQQFSATVYGTGSYSSAVTWSASGGSISSSGVFTPTAVGTYIITARSVQNPAVSGITQITVTAGSCVTPPSVVSISVQPKTFTCVVGGEFTLGANVTVTAGSNLSTAVTWSLSDQTVASLRSTTQNQAVFNCLKVGTVTATARAMADPSKSDSATGTVTPNGPQCTFTPSIAPQPDGKTFIINTGQTFTGTASCTGGNGLPAGYSSDPSRVGITGNQPTGGIYQTGTVFTIKGLFTGQATVGIQASLTQTSPSVSWTVIVK